MYKNRTMLARGTAKHTGDYFRRHTIVLSVFLLSKRFQCTVGILLLYTGTRITNMSLDDVDDYGVTMKHSDKATVPPEGQ